MDQEGRTNNAADLPDDGERIDSCQHGSSWNSDLPASVHGEVCGVRKTEAHDFGCEVVLGL